MIVSEYLPLNIPDVGILLPDALEVGELQLEAGQARGEHRVGFCNLEQLPLKIIKPSGGNGS